MRERVQVGGRDGEEWEQGEQTFEDDTEGALADLPAYAVVAADEVGRGGGVVGGHGRGDGGEGGQDNTARADHRLSSRRQTETGRRFDGDAARIVPWRVARCPKKVHAHRQNPDGSILLEPATLDGDVNSMQGVSNCFERLEDRRQCTLTELLRHMRKLGEVGERANSVELIVSPDCILAFSPRFLTRRFNSLAHFES